MSLIVRISADNFVPVRRELGLHDLSGDGFVLQPRTQPWANTPAFFNEIWRRKDLATPKNPVVTGHVDPAILTSNLWNFRIGTFVVKPPQSDMVYIPRELEQFLPFVQSSIDHEFAANKNALNRRALLIVESDIPEIGKPYRPHARDLHGHPPYISKDQSPFDPANRSDILNTHYYVATSRNPTCFYTGEIDEGDIDATGFKIANNEKYKCDFQPEPGDISLFTSVHAHQTAIEEERTHDEPRIFAGVFFEDPRSNGEPARPNPMLQEIIKARVRGRPDDAIALTECWRHNALSHASLTKCML